MFCCHLVGKRSSHDAGDPVVPGPQRLAEWPEPFPGPPTHTLAFSGQVALSTSKGHRRLLEGCVASAGHTSMLISGSPSKYVSGDEVQVLWDSWAKATLWPRSGPAPASAAPHRSCQHWLLLLHPGCPDAVHSVSPLSPDTCLHAQGRMPEAHLLVLPWALRDSASRGARVQSHPRYSRPVSRDIASLIPP